MFMPFIIDISDIRDEIDGEKSFQGALKLKPIKMGERLIKLPREVQVTGVARNVKNGIMVEGDIDTELRLECSRCLEEYEAHITGRLEEFFSWGRERDESAEETEAEIFPIIGNKLDLEAAINQLIASEIPFKALCRADCAGICPICGKNKNLFPHSCREGAVDIRMAKLKDYFKKSQEG